MYRLYIDIISQKIYINCIIKCNKYDERALYYIIVHCKLRTKLYISQKDDFKFENVDFKKNLVLLNSLQLKVH